MEGQRSFEALFASPLTTPSLARVCVKQVLSRGYSWGKVCIFTCTGVVMVTEVVMVTMMTLMRLTLRVSRGCPTYTEAVAPRDPATKSMGTSYLELVSPAKCHDDMTYPDPNV